MKKLKINLLAIIGMMVAVATLAFTAPKEERLATSWYLVEEVNGHLTLTNESQNTPSTTCPFTDSTNRDLCAVAIEETGLSGMTLQEVEDENIPIEEERFKDPEP